MNAVLFATDFSPASYQTLDYALHVADEWRARILFTHVIADQNDNIQSPGIKSPSAREERSYLPVIRQFKEKVIRYAFDNNCEMRTGHLLLKGDFSGNIASAIRKCKPYALIASLGPFTGKRDPGNDCMQKILQCKIPLMIIPESAQFSRIRNIGFFSSPSDTPRFPEALLQMAALFGARILFFLAHSKGYASCTEYLRTTYREEIKYGHLSIHSFERKPLASSINRVAEEMKLQMLACWGGDPVFSVMYNSRRTMLRCLKDKPMMCYPAES